MTTYVEEYPGPMRDQGGSVTQIPEMPPINVTAVAAPNDVTLSDDTGLVIISTNDAAGVLITPTVGGTAMDAVPCYAGSYRAMGFPKAGAPRTISLGIAVIV